MGLETDRMAGPYIDMPLPQRRISLSECESKRTLYLGAVQKPKNEDGPKAAILFGDEEVTVVKA